MTTKHPGILRQLCQHVKQDPVHVTRVALKKPSTPGDEQCIAGEDSALVRSRVNDIIANVAFGMTRGV